MPLSFVVGRAEPLAERSRAVGGAEPSRWLSEAEASGLFLELPKCTKTNPQQNNLLSLRRFYSYLPKDYPCQNSIT